MSEILGFMQIPRGNTSCKSRPGICMRTSYCSFGYGKGKHLLRLDFPAHSVNHSCPGEARSQWLVNFSHLWRSLSCKHWTCLYDKKQALSWSQNVIDHNLSPWTRYMPATLLSMMSYSLDQDLSTDAMLLLPISVHAEPSLKTQGVCCKSFSPTHDLTARSFSLTSEICRKGFPNRHSVSTNSIFQLKSILEIVAHLL